MGRAWPPCGERTTTSLQEVERSHLLRLGCKVLSGSDGGRWENPSRRIAASLPPEQIQTRNYVEWKAFIFKNGNTQSSIRCASWLIQKATPVLLKVLLTLRAADWALRLLLLSLSVPHLHPPMCWMLI